MSGMPAPFNMPTEILSSYLDPTSPMYELLGELLDALFAYSYCDRTQGASASLLDGRATKEGSQQCGRVGRSDEH